MIVPSGSFCSELVAGNPTALHRVLCACVRVDSSLPVVDLSLPCCCIVSVRKPTGTQVIAEEVTKSPKKSDNQRLWVEQSIEVPRKGTLDNLVSEPQQVAFKGLNRRTKNRRNKTCSRVQGWAQKFTEKVGQFVSHSVLCCSEGRFLYDRPVQ